MSMVNLDRQAQALKGTFVYEGERHGKDETPSGGWPLCVALSAEVGTPAIDVAHEVGHRLGWPVHDGDILKRVADDLGINVATLDSFDERRRSWLLECLESLSSRPIIGEYVIVRGLVRQLRILAAAGHCVIVGRGAAQLLPVDSTLRVRLVGTREDRVEDVVHRYGVHREQAARMLDELEAERARFIRDHLNHDPRDINAYDLVVNTSHFPPAECAGLIIEGIHQREAHA